MVLDELVSAGVHGISIFPSFALSLSRNILGVHVSSLLFSFSFLPLPPLSLFSGYVGFRFLEHFVYLATYLFHHRRYFGSSLIHSLLDWIVIPRIPRTYDHHCVTPQKLSPFSIPTTFADITPPPVISSP